MKCAKRVTLRFVYSHGSLYENARGPSCLQAWQVLSHFPISGSGETAGRFSGRGGLEIFFTPPAIALPNLRSINNRLRVGGYRKQGGVRQAQQLQSWGNLPSPWSLSRMPEAVACCTLARGMYTRRDVRLLSYGCSSPLPHSNSGTKSNQYWC